ncbi:hypothetical protein [Kordia sp.]|uniref:hypothetical protein n=1 Tax=Kordia sp. TaxID=1965332 RepID=UPI003B58CF96
MRVLFSICIFLSTQFVMTQNSSEARAQIWSLLKKNNKDSYQMMQHVYNFPNEFSIQNSVIQLSEPGDFMTYVRGYETRQLLEDISTVVHECTHEYQSRKPLEILSKQSTSNKSANACIVYYIDKTEEYLVERTQTFPSVQIARLIPEEVRFFRYETYVNTNEEYLGTQQHGIYGLLEEWSAYLNGFRTSIRNFSAYKKLGMEGLKGYLEDTGSIKITYPEFKCYMLHYLSYARKNNPGIYQQIIQNKDFKKAYHAIDNRFVKLMKAHEKNIALIQAEVIKSGLAFELKDNFYWLGNNGIGAYQQEYNTLATHVSTPIFKNVLADLKR